MVKKVKNPKKQIAIFFLSLIIIVIVLVLISIAFSGLVPKNAPTNTGTNTTIGPFTSGTITPNPSSTMSVQETGGHEHGSKIVTEYGETGTPAQESDLNDQNSNKINIQTISGKPFDKTKLKFKYSDWVIIDFSLSNPDRLSINRCISTYANNIKFSAADDNKPKDYNDQVKKALTQIDVKSDGNTFDNGVDQSC